MMIYIVAFTKATVCYVTIQELTLNKAILLHNRDTDIDVCVCCGMRVVCVRLGDVCDDVSVYE